MRKEFQTTSNMLKNKIDELIESLAFTLAMSEDEIRVLRAAFVDIVREAVGEIVGAAYPECACKNPNCFHAGYNERVFEEKVITEEILNQLK